MKKYFGKILGAVATLGAASSAMAADPTPIESLFSGVNLDGVTDAVLAVGLSVVAITLVFVGIRLVKRALSSI